ncbi:MAG: cation-translocating P-type ATPase [Campylobacterota bacterium]
MQERLQAAHAVDAQEILQEIGVASDRGLDTNQIAQLRQEYGKNELTQKRQKSKLLLFMQQFNQPLVYILLVAAIVTALLGHYVDSAVIFGVILINSIIGYIQELKAITAIEALSKMGKVSATVMREGEKTSIDAKELVVGDIVLLYSGDKVPADIRLIKSKELQSDESSLTGESVSVEKLTDKLSADTTLADRSNMVYSSSLITSGSAVGVVTAVGNDTQIGKINTMIDDADILETPLTIKIAQFSKVLLYIILAMALFTFVVGMLRGGEAIEMFLASVALAVAAIPEGLPAAMTIILAIGVSKMAQQNALIRKLPAVETLGSTTVICSDKTGTLTQNEMTVKAIYAGAQNYSVDGVGYDAKGSINSIDKEAPAENEALQRTLKAGVLCNESNVVKKGNRYQVIGDPTEGALVVSGKKGGFERDMLEDELIHIDTLDFDSKNQYMASYYGAKNRSSSHIYIKGSLEKILERCEVMLDAQGNEVAIDRQQIVEEAEKMAKEGMRVLAFAYMSVQNWIESLEHHHIENGLTFLGLQAMIDPPRSEVKDSIASCYGAGIGVKMITGDHKITALAIAKEIGIKTDGKISALSGTELEKMDDAALLEVISEVNVFARVTPQQKLRLVKLLQQKKNIVAMTGDGVNDAPALKQANIGTAMGITGTEVSKEAADMILTDDNFTTIKNAVEEGRGVYANIIKFITWILPTNVGQGLVIVAAVMLAFELPLSPVQVLWVNMTTAVLLGLTLAFEPKESGLMEYPPRDVDAAILSKELLVRVVYVGGMLLVLSFFAFWYVKHGIGGSLEQARTAAVNIFIFGQTFYLFNCRSMQHSMFTLGVFTNRWMLIGIGAMVFFQLLFIYAPFMNTLFGTAPLGVSEWIIVGISSLIIYSVVEIEKKIRNKNRY